MIGIHSLRGKIIAGYAAIAVLAIGLSLFSYLELRLLERRIVAGERIGEFFDIALEIRRFEKNYFLYRQSADLAENSAYVDRARALLREHAAAFAGLAAPDRLARLAAELDRYAGLMAAHGQGRGGLAAEIRQTGKIIVTEAETLARAERGELQAMLDRHRNLLIGAVAAVGLLVVAIGRLLTQRVGRPLLEMERNMREVASGRRAKLDMAGGDREIESLGRAFDHVLHELETRQGQLVRSEKLAALGTLLSGVAHELNNPLSNIGSSAQILAEEVGAGGTAFQHELIGQIDEETWRARRIVRSLLDYARDREFKREPLALAPLVDDTLRLIRSRIPAHVAVTTDIAGDLQITGDRQRLQQALINLLGNAVEAVAGAGEVSVAARRTREPCPRGAMVFGQCAADEVVEIAVADNGQGIAADILPKIFDPFFTTKEVGQGLGLGLFIVFEIIEEHGGCVAVESEVGKGTAFRLRLPQGASNG